MFTLHGSSLRLTELKTDDAGNTVPGRSITTHGRVTVTMAWADEPVPPAGVVDGEFTVHGVELCRPEQSVQDRLRAELVDVPPALRCVSSWSPATGCVPPA
jgi:hypothetical protein